MEKTDKDDATIKGDFVALEALGLSVCEDGSLIAVLQLEGGQVAVIDSEALNGLISKVASLVEQDDAKEQGLPDEVVEAIGEAADAVFN